MVNLILCGGSGTRLWPLSRAKTPKQFQPLFDGKSLFEETVERNRGLADRIMLASNAEQTALASRQMAGLGLRLDDGVIEPVGRNTAPAIALALLVLPADELVLVTPSDHRITALDAYAEAVARAAELARSGALVTFGIRPSYPETGYGYIESDGETVRTFKEKPDSATAEAYLRSGRYLWNSGMFLFRASAFLDELAEHAPDMLAACKRARNRAPAARPLAPSREDMLAIPSVSIDYAVMEKSDNVKVVACDLGWTDLGSFDALYDEAVGADGNAVLARGAQVLDSARCLVVGGRRAIVLAGVEDLVVVDTDDALLVMRRGESQKVREVVQAIKETRPELL